MALAATVVWEVRATGADTNGGAFNAASAGTDRSLQDAAQVNIDNSAITCTTPGANSNTLTFTGGTYTATSADVGNIVQITAGTNINAGFYEITAQGGTTWTLAGATNLTTAGGAGSAVVGKMGGGLLTIGKAGSAMVAGNDLYLKSNGVTPYTITSASSNVAAGCLTLPAATGATNISKLVGYTTTHTDGAPTRPILKANGVITSFILVTLAANTRVENVEFDGNSRTTSRGVTNAGTNNSVYNCVFRNCTDSGVVGNSLSRTVVVLCYATGCSAQPPFVDGICYGCVAWGNTVSGFFGSGNIATFINCISAGNSGGASLGFNLNQGGYAVGCTAYNNGAAGFQWSASNPGAAVNCLAVNNATYGFTAGNTPQDSLYLYNCAGYNNTSGNVNASAIPAAQQIGFVTLTGDPFTNAAGNDFSLNGTAGAGAAARGAGFPATFNSISTSNYPDIGGAQHRDSGTSRARVVNGA